MKHRYIESLLTELKLLTSKVENLKADNKVPFSFFKESFKRTQEITRLLHELEFVQIEEMKGQMEKMIQLLSDAESSKKNVVVETIEPIAKVDEPEEEAIKKEELNASNNEDVVDKVEPIKDDEATLAPETAATTEEEEEEKSEFLSMGKAENGYAKKEEEDEVIQAPSINAETAKGTVAPSGSVVNTRAETILADIAPKNKSLNDVQPVNQTIQDVKRSISLNDRFLFQRELFDNNREAMNTMLVKLQSFSSFNLIESYLKRNTTWDFSDETVDKFLQMLKDSFR